MTRPMLRDGRTRQAICDCCVEQGLDSDSVIEFIEHEWILLEEAREASPLDQEDIARARLIVELRRDFGVNDEAVPLILHLVDELHALRRIATRRAG